MVNKRFSNTPTTHTVLPCDLRPDGYVFVSVGLFIKIMITNKIHRWIFTTFLEWLGHRTVSNQLLFEVILIQSQITVMRCPSVRLSVPFVHSVQMNKHIFRLFFTAGSRTILVFSYQTSWQYSDGDPPPLTGAPNAGGVGTYRDSESIPSSIACCKRFDR